MSARSRKTKLLSPLLFLAVVALVAPIVTWAQAAASWVGSWYMETKEEKTFNGKSYDIRRELTVLRSDGTGTNAWRYYAGSELVGEFRSTFAWGVENGVYWTQCRTLLLTNTAAPCTSRSEFDVLSTTSQEIRHRSRKSGITYNMQRVNDGFALP